MAGATMYWVSRTEPMSRQSRVMVPAVASMVTSSISHTPEG
jgi:hypothetical protein